MNKALMVVALGLSALAGCAADTSDPVADDGSRSAADKIILVDSKTPIVLPAEDPGRARIAIAGEAESAIVLEQLPEIEQYAGATKYKVDPKHIAFPCQTCARGENALER